MTADTAYSTHIQGQQGDNIGMETTTFARILRGSFHRISQSIGATFRFVGRLGFGRSGGLAATRRAFPRRALTPLRMAMSLVVGSLLIGTGIALLTEARLGLGPFDVLASGLQPHLGLSLGQTVWTISGFLFIVAAVLGQRPSRWGIAYVGSIGFAIDAVSGSINGPASLFGRSLFVVAALATISAGISLVVHSGSTGGSLELLMKAGEVRGMDRRTVRTSLEVAVLVIGIALGGSFGPATIVIALGIGPALGVMGQALEDHSHGRMQRQRQLLDSPETRHPSAATR